MPEIFQKTHIFFTWFFLVSKFGGSMLPALNWVFSRPKSLSLSLAVWQSEHNPYLWAPFVYLKDEGGWVGSYSVSQSSTIIIVNVSLIQALCLLYQISLVTTLWCVYYYFHHIPDRKLDWEVWNLSKVTWWGSDSSSTGTYFGPRSQDAAAVFTAQNCLRVHPGRGPPDLSIYNRFSPRLSQSCQ